MKKSTVIPGLWLPTDVVDGPGWTDVDGYYVSAKSDRHSLHERTQPQNRD